jgi:hypothetical protein
LSRDTHEAGIAVVACFGRERREVGVTPSVDSHQIGLWGKNNLHGQIASFQFLRLMKTTFSGYQKSSATAKLNGFVGFCCQSHCPRLLPRFGAVEVSELWQPAECVVESGNARLRRELRPARLMPTSYAKLKLI